MRGRCRVMFEQISPSVRVAKAGTGIGVVTHGASALLVDSGLDENLVRKVTNSLQNEGVSVAAVVNTHAHADHIGGNAWVAKRTGCLIAAPHYEHYFVEHPDLEPYTLFGAGAPKALQGKFLQAQPSTVGQQLHEGEQDVAGFRIRAHALGGHSVGQMGIEVDGTIFVGDALLPEATLSKYGLVFAVDPVAARASTERLRTLADRTIVSYHGGVVGDVDAAVRANADAMHAAEEAALAFLGRAPASAEDVLVALLDRFPPAQLTVELYALQAATVRGYLAALERAGRVEAYIEGARLLWRAR
ncbi:MAG TPA: MBL fold metallo-hydrolase [Candidatus Thermoplasmatota archaeon]|nr:MBL fold metallo-hydrolase [Candidatus Thermoplasmatota archaeon]